jgi:hypothetical protein
MTKAQVLRGRPSTSSILPAEPKSTWASSPGGVSTRSTTSGVGGSRQQTKRTTEA